MCDYMKFEIDEITKSHKKLNYMNQGDNIGFVEFYDNIYDLEIIDVYVEPLMRKKGIGTNLLKELIKLASGKEKIFLEVSIENENAKKIYFKLGFEQIGIREKYYNNKIDAIVMKLDLNK